MESSLIVWENFSFSKMTYDDSYLLMDTDGEYSIFSIRTALQTGVMTPKRDKFIAMAKIKLPHFSWRTVS